VTESVIAIRPLTDQEALDVVRGLTGKPNATHLASVHYWDTDIRDVGHNMNIEVVTQLTGRWVCHP